jgi:hypothetical protein
LEDWNSYMQLAYRWSLAKPTKRKTTFRNYLSELPDDALLPVFDLLFPSEYLSRQATLSLIANELDYPVSVFEDIVEGHDLAQLIASECMHQQPTNNLTVGKVLELRNRVVSHVKGSKGTQGKWVLKMMSKEKFSETEARLFWCSVMNKRDFIRQRTFLHSCMRNGVTVVDVDNQLLVRNASEVLELMIREPEQLGVNVEWYETPSLHLQPRKFMKYDSTVLINDYNDGVYQALPDYGKTAMTLITNKNGKWMSRTCTRSTTGAFKNVDIPPLGLGEKGAIIEHTLESEASIVDILFLDEPELGFLDRMEKAHWLKVETQDYLFAELVRPETLLTWRALNELPKDYSVRFPNKGAFKPDEEGGYIVVKDAHIHNLRLNRVEGDEESGELSIIADCLDGTEFWSVARVAIQLDDPLDSIMYQIRNRYPAMQIDEELPEEVCIVVRVSSPYYDSDSMYLAHPVLVEINNELGYSDVVQFTDIV